MKLAMIVSHKALRQLGGEGEDVAGGAEALEVGLEFIDAFLGEFLHHLPIVDERPIGIDRMVPFMGVVAGDVDSPLDPPAESGALGA